MPTDQSVVVQRTWLGVVSIGREHHAPAGAAEVSLRGCLVTVDPCMPGRPPYCLVSDPDGARAVIAALYGPMVALKVGASDGPVDADDHVPYVPGPAMPSVLRLGEVRWLRTHSPLPLDQRLLELEETVLLGHIGELLDSLDEEWLGPLADFGDELLKLADLDVILPSGLGHVVTDALGLLADHLPVTDRLRAAAARRMATWSPPLDVPEVKPSLDSPGLSRGLAPVGALHAGVDSSLFVGDATVDWDDVPRGATSRSEDNVQWALVVAEDRVVVTVGVERAEQVTSHPALERRPSSVDELSFDVLLPGWPVPVGAGRLTPTGPDGSWIGRARMGSSARVEVEAAVDRGETITIRVHAGATWPPAHPLEAQAQRFAARGVSLLRLNEVQPEESFRESAAASLRRAESLWKATGFGEAAGICGNLAAQAVPRAPRRVWGQPAPEKAEPLPTFTLSLAERWFGEASM